ncbi:hypothetical protein AgCh_005192 [Apium graveolens]
MGDFIIISLGKYLESVTGSCAKKSAKSRAESGFFQICTAARLGCAGDRLEMQGDFIIIRLGKYLESVAGSCAKKSENREQKVDFSRSCAGTRLGCAGDRLEMQAPARELRRPPGVVLIMDRSWLRVDRRTQEFKLGVEELLRVVFLGSATSGWDNASRRKMKMRPVVASIKPLDGIRTRMGMKLKAFQPRQTHPGNDIDVFLPPLIADLKKLWHGKEMYYAYKQEWFIWRGILLWTISDYPALRSLSGNIVKGYNDCVVCVVQTKATTLPNYQKTVVMRHRRSILDAHKLTGPNYADWLRNLRIVLRIEKLEYVIDSPKPTEPASDAHNDEHVVYHKWIDDANVAQCIMLASMNIELQKQHEHMDAHTILMHLQELYDVAGRTARYEISKELFGCRMSEGSSVNDHVLKMINLIEHLGQLGFVMDGELSQDLLLQSLPSLFSQFVVNFHMNKLDVSLPELHNMLKTAESNFPPKKSSILLIGEGSNPKKRKRNPSKKKKVDEKMPVPPKAEDPKSKVVCFHCNKGPRRSRTLEEEEVILLMGNGARVAAEDVESFHLHRPTGKTIV